MSLVQQRLGSEEMNSEKFFSLARNDTFVARPHFCRHFKKFPKHDRFLITAQNSPPLKKELIDCIWLPWHFKIDNLYYNWRVHGTLMKSIKL